jgi:hypothetical protein
MRISSVEVGEGRTIVGVSLGNGVRVAGGKGVGLESGVEQDASSTPSKIIHLKNRDFIQPSSTHNSDPFL